MLHLIEGLELDPINVLFSIRPSFVRWRDISEEKGFLLSGRSRFRAKVGLEGGNGSFQFGSVETRPASGLTFGIKVDGRP